MAPSPASSTMLLDLVALIARSLVDHPEKVTVREVTGDRFPRIELSVAREDIGKVIGKDGRTAQSIRALLNAAASKAGLRAHLDILD
ncbi:KH domain-containing protein [Polyangium sorediatum]|nr:MULTISPECIES: KH domain-containing protein [Polyangium]MDI1432205.1 KH domain-containing protein [Polyangium sorediatum]MDI1475824.1 KH domain-containing protein [Polyangium sp. y55x31]MDI3283984.1 KH domain-containing protein [Polyangium sp. 15x6]